MSKFSLSDPDLVSKLAALIKPKAEGEQISICLTNPTPFGQPEIQRVLTLQWDANLIAGRLQRSLRMSYSLSAANRELTFQLLVGGQASPYEPFVELTPGATRYFYSQIDDKESYQRIVDACRRICPEVYFLQSAGVTKERLDKVLEAVRRDYPEFWFLNFKSGIGLQSQGSIITTVTIYRSENIDRQQIIRMDTELRAQAKELLQEVRGGAGSAYQIQERLYECLTHHVNKDYDSEFAHTVYGCLVQKRCDCAGIAHTVKFIADMANLEVITANEEGLAWNIIKINGDYYHFDVATDLQSEDHRYMNLNDANFFCPPRRLLSGLTLPACNSMEFNYHNQRHCLVRAGAKTADEQIEACVVDAVKAKRDQVIIYFDRDVHFDTGAFAKNNRLTPILQRVEQRTAAKPQVRSINYWEQGIKFTLQ